MDPVFIRELAAEEGIRLKAYDDATGIPLTPGYTLVGHPTIGIGRSLDIEGISTAEASQLLDNDIAGLVTSLNKLGWWNTLSPVRQFVIISMAFNMGMDGMLAFTVMISAIHHGNFSAAADAMLHSKWQQQVPSRARRLSDAMRTGSFPSVGEPPVFA